MDPGWRPRAERPRVIGVFPGSIAHTSNAHAGMSSLLRGLLVAGFSVQELGDNANKSYVKRA
jgi:hypothetical protein